LELCSQFGINSDIANDYDVDQVNKYIRKFPQGETIWCVRVTIAKTGAQVMFVTHAITVTSVTVRIMVTFLTQL